LLTRSPEYREKIRIQNEKYGCLRSGEGTAEEIAEKRKAMEERLYI